MRLIETTARRRLWPGILLVTVLAIFLWRLPLFADRTIIHGDSIAFGLPLFDLAARAYWGKASLLWASTIYGGHPLFAEGQGAFANPLSILIDMLVAPLAGPIFAMNFFHLACMLLAGTGMLGLAGRLGLGSWASATAALAVAFSPLWINMQSNPVVGGTFLWTPWCLWALEAWLQRPDLRSAAFLGSSCAAMLLAGYPQGLHGTLLYMAISLAIEPLHAARRRTWATLWRRRLTTGCFAASLGLGLSAVQWLPLLELVGQSHRHAGIGLILQSDGMTFLRGVFYAVRNSPLEHASFPSLGSPLICGFALFALFMKPPPRILGHMLAAGVLMQLGFGTGSSLFRFVYAYHLIPGLEYFRVVFLYLAIGIVGLAIAAGWAIDRMALWLSIKRPVSRVGILGISSVAALWLWGAAALWTPDAEPAQLYLALLAGVVLAALAISPPTRWARLVPPVMLALVTIEVGVRLAPFQMAKSESLRRPADVAAIQLMPDWRDFKVLDTTIASTYAFMDPRTPGLTGSMQNMMSAMAGLTSVMWGLHSMDGALALPLARREAVRQPMLDEIHGISPLPPGLRLIDVLGVRYIASPTPAPAGSSLRPFWHAGDAPWIVENTTALSRFQAYTDHVTVEDPEAALAFMRTWTKRTLVIERPADPTIAIPSDDRAAPVPDVAAPPLQFEVLKANDTYYRLALRATRPAWLFLADANYPGWHAYLDGTPTPVFSAQVLGKAVAIPVGAHELVLAFEPASFRWGLGITLGTMALTAAALWAARWRARRLPSPEPEAA